MPLPAFTAAITKVTNLEWSEKPDGGVSTYKNGIYCGPGWGYTYKDILDGKIKEMPKAIDAIDEACRLHDTCYEENGYLTQGCNLVLSANLVDVIIAKDSTPKQRAAATIMAAIFFVESQTIDVGVMGKREYDRMYDRMVGYMGEQMHTLEQAINREIMARSMPPFGR